MSAHLNPAQKASLATVLRMFEESLRYAESWLESPPTEGILYRQELHLTTSQRARARKRISAALAEISNLANEIGLEQAVENPAGLIRGKMSIAWANLIDSQSGKLKRYGEVHPAVAREIDPHLRRLAQAALELAHLFDNQTTIPAAPDAEAQTD